MHNTILKQSFLFQLDGEGYDNKLSLNREQFVEALSLILNKGTRGEVTYNLDGNINVDFFYYYDIDLLKEIIFTIIILRMPTA